MNTHKLEYDGKSIEFKATKEFLAAYSTGGCDNKHRLSCVECPCYKKGKCFLKGSTGFLFKDTNLTELKMEEFNLTKEEALLACIGGAKIVGDNFRCINLSYINGKFIFSDGRKRNINVLVSTKFKILKEEKIYNIKEDFNFYLYTNTGQLVLVDKNSTEYEVKGYKNITNQVRF